MFDIGWTELLIIAVVAIIVVGPKDLPGMLRTLGRYAGKLKRTAGEFRSQFDDALRESELDELRSTMRDMGDMNPVNQIKDGVTQGLNPLKETADEIRKGVESSTGSASAGRMNTDPAPSAKSKAAAKPSAKEEAKPKPKRAKSGSAKKPAAGKGSGSSAKSRASASSAKAEG